MEISLFDENVPLKLDRVVLYPYPDLKRIWARVWLSTLAEEKPNIEIILLDPDGIENCSVYLMNHAEQRAETTLHLRNPVAGQTYPVIVELTRGLGDAVELIDRQQFELALVFRNPEAGEPGFGFGVDWDEVKRKSGRL
ncbi:MAG TPA: hypothetical protein PKY73_15190 [Hyphomonas sp.]|nr:hypothetical protein [Hyphomonas sp.]